MTQAIARVGVRLLLIFRAAAARILAMALLGLTVPTLLCAADFKFTQIGYPYTLATEVLASNEQGANHPNAGAERHDYTRGDVPGRINSKRQSLKGGASARAGQFNYTQVDVPGAVFTGLFAINSRGQTVGLYVDGSGTAHGLVRGVDGSIVTVDYPGAIFIGANGINSQGDVVGRWDDASGITHSFLRTSQGAITSFDPPTPCVATIQPSAAHGINDLGDIVGRCFDASGKELGWLLRHDGSFAVLDNPAFLTTDAWAIDNSGVVVGDYSDADEFVHGYTWTEASGFTTLDFESNMTGLRAINQRGDISGIYFDGLTLHGFLRVKNGTEVTIDPPGSVETDSAVINNSGMIAGVYWDADFNAHGYIAIAAATEARGINAEAEAVGRWDSNSVPLNVVCSTQCHGFLWAKSEFRSIEVTGANSTVALGLDNSDRIVGGFIDSAGGEHEFHTVFVNKRTTNKMSSQFA